MQKEWILVCEQFLFLGILRDYFSKAEDITPYISTKKAAHLFEKGYVARFFIVI